MSEQLVNETEPVSFGERAGEFAGLCGSVSATEWRWSREDGRAILSMDRARKESKKLEAYGGARLREPKSMRPDDPPHAAGRRGLLLHRAVKEGEMSLAPGQQGKDQGQAGRAGGRAGQRGQHEGFLPEHLRGF